MRQETLNTSVLVSGPTLLDEVFLHNLFPVFINKMEVVGRLKCLHMHSCGDLGGASSTVLRSVVWGVQVPERVAKVEVLLLPERTVASALSWGPCGTSHFPPMLS